MDLEETKKIIESEIEAEAVRRQIKSYIDEKQNLREGFTETFKPLIESQEAVKASIDKEQNAMIEQLQKNQKALTEGLDKNRLAITSGFDKMDEVKKWDLQQLPGYEAIEEPEKESVKKLITTTVIYGKDEMDKHLNIKKTKDLLDSFGLKLPSNYKDKSMEEFQEAFVKGREVAANLKRKIKNVAYYEIGTDTGILRAYPDK